MAVRHHGDVPHDVPGHHRRVVDLLVCVLYGLHWSTGNPVYLQMFRFWRRIFAVGFAIGVVAGIVVSFEMGLNWGIYAAKTGPIIGPIIGMEVVTAFFVEAGFIGILLYGDGRVSQATMFVATVIVAIGTLLSSSWIIAANSWSRPGPAAGRPGRSAEPERRARPTHRAGRRPARHGPRHPGRLARCPVRRELR
jgi:hypothetical protein